MRKHSLAGNLVDISHANMAVPLMTFPLAIIPYPHTLICMATQISTIARVQTHHVQVTKFPYGKSF